MRTMIMDLDFICCGNGSAFARFPTLMFPTVCVLPQWTSSNEKISSSVANRPISCQLISCDSKFTQPTMMSSEPQIVTPVPTSKTEIVGVDAKWAALFQIGDTIPCDRPEQFTRAIPIGSKTLMVPEVQNENHLSSQFQERDERSSDEAMMSVMSNCHSLILTNGIIVSEIAEGWLSKKGSGHDMIGNRGFKPRWSKLVLMSVPDCVEHEALAGMKTVPVLHMYWHQYSSAPSSSIVLDNASIAPLEKCNEHSWTACVHRFEIRDRSNRNLWVKTFCAPKNERDQWVEALIVATESHEAEKAKMKLKYEKERRKKELPPTPRQFVRPNNIHLKAIPLHLQSVHNAGHC